MKHKTVYKSDFFCEDCNLTWSDLGDSCDGVDALDTEYAQPTKKFTVETPIDNVEEVFQGCDILTKDKEEYSTNQLAEEALSMKEKKKKRKYKSVEGEETVEDDEQKEANSEQNSEDSASVVYSSSLSSESSHFLKYKQKNKSKFQILDGKVLSTEGKIRDATNFESEQSEDDLQHKETENGLAKDSSSISSKNLHSSETCHSVLSKQKKDISKNKTLDGKVLSTDGKIRNATNFESEQSEDDLQHKEAESGLAKDSSSISSKNLHSSSEEYDSSDIYKNKTLGYEHPKKYFDKDFQLDLDAMNSVLKDYEKSNNSFCTKFKKMDFTINWDIPVQQKPMKGIFSTKWDKSIRGKLPPEDINYINRRLKKFCKLNKLNIDDIVIFTRVKTSYKMKNSTRLLFLQYLSKDLKNRTPLSVFKYLSRLGTRRGRFTALENEFLIHMYNNYTGRNLHNLCALLLNRHRHNIYLHYQTLQDFLGCKAKIKEMEGEELGRAVLVSLLSRVKKKNVKILMSTLSHSSWKAVSNENGISRGLAQAIFLCSLSPRLYATKPIHYYDLSCMIIKKVHGCTLNDAPWGQLATSYGVTKMFIYGILRKLVETYVPREKWNNFEGSIDVLYHKVLPTLEEKCKEDLVLSRILIEKES